jgi:peroxiredoxin
MATPIPVGSVAPDFALPRTPDQKLALSELRGQPVVLVFYPADWSPVCSDQLAVYSEACDMFAQHHAQLVGISVDGVWCHAAFTHERKLGFPLLADFEPKGAVARQYGVFREAEGVCDRALFVIDPDGRVAWRHVSPVAINPGAEGILEALERMQQRGAA